VFYKCSGGLKYNTVLLLLLLVTAVEQVRSLQPKF
jgi:hypothetical protein